MWGEPPTPQAHEIGHPMKNYLKLASVGAAAAIVTMLLSGAAASATTPQQDTMRTAVVNGGQTVALPPVTAGVQPDKAAPSALAASSAAVNGPSSLQHRCFPAGQFLSGAQVAQWLGTGASGDSPWPADNSNRVWAANGGWVGGNMQWAMMNPGGDDMRRIYVFFRSSC